MDFLGDEATGGQPMTDDEIFAALVEDTLETLMLSRVVELSAFAFLLGDAFARLRNSFDVPDIEDIADLKALYLCLEKRFALEYFQEHCALSLPALYDSVVDWPAIEERKRNEAATPPDVRTMIDIYNAVWNLHYNDFLHHPSDALTAWNVNDKHQYRAISAVLHDIPYIRLVHLCRVMVQAEQEAMATGKPKAMQRTIAKKCEKMLAIMCNREETPTIIIEHIAAARNGEAIDDILRGLAAVLKKRHVSRATLFDSVTGSTSVAIYGG